MPAEIQNDQLNLTLNTIAILGLEVMWSTKPTVAQGDLLVVWLVKSTNLVFPLNLML